VSLIDNVLANQNAQSSNIDSSVGMVKRKTIS